MDPLISTDQLARELGAHDLRILDATYFLPEHGRDAPAEHEAAHIPGAAFLDLASLRDTDSPHPNMLPSADRFAERLRELGVGDGDRIVLYDDTPLRSSARAWWMLRSFGVGEVTILDGGLAKWRAENRPLASGRERGEPRAFTARLDPTRLRTLDQMRANLSTGAEQVLDARSLARFTGEEPDPRPHVAEGHIPGSRNLHYSDLFEPDGTWKRGEALRAEFNRAGIDLSRPLVTTCNSGVTAAVLLFAAHLLGTDAALYDGSWSEWGADPHTPKEVGAA
ncbi:sulfurtransferase [Sphingomonas lenta]|uniref:Sulfurtransferase n=1 Tax=Sphingomonas lenta TaxID=1141887 RepID=A0A2A2SD77_9SPHN|nr:sulfurtransferase [Sphingomonas lenta]PAX07150.1 3-mercaptopyruvate sulfurtransferase [Sphingomonas lenta]